MVEIVRGDITALDVDAIVNAANSTLTGGGGVDGAIHRVAGPGLREELRHFGGCPTGGAVRTRGHRLPARFVIHAVGPVWHGGGENEAALLASAYQESFARAREEPSIHTIAFSAISTGVYGYPREAAAQIAVRAMRAHEAEFERIVACVFDEETERIYLALAETRTARGR